VFSGSTTSFNFLLIFEVNKKNKSTGHCTESKHSVPSWPVMQPIFFLFFPKEEEKRKKKSVSHIEKIIRKVTFVTPYAFLYVNIYKYLYIYLQATTYTPVELLGPCYKTGRTVVSQSLKHISYVI